MADPRASQLSYQQLAKPQQVTVSLLSSHLRCEMGDAFI